MSNKKNCNSYLMNFWDALRNVLQVIFLDLWYRTVLIDLRWSWRTPCDSLTLPLPPFLLISLTALLFHHFIVLKLGNPYCYRVYRVFGSPSSCHICMQSCSQSKQRRQERRCGGCWLGIWGWWRWWSRVMGFLEFARLQCAPQSVLALLRGELLSGSQVPAPCSMGGEVRKGKGAYNVQPLLFTFISTFMECRWVD